MLSRSERRQLTRYREITGGIVVREMPPVEKILKDHRLCLDTWHFYKRLGVGHPTDCLYPMGETKPNGYWLLYMFDYYWAEHRLIWKVVTGNDPVGVIDHINGIRDDNRIENLRDVPMSVNALNVVRGRFDVEMAARKLAAKELKALEKQARQAANERRERALLAKLKAKYEQ